MVTVRLNCYHFLCGHFETAAAARSSTAAARTAGSRIYKITGFTDIKTSLILAL